LIASVLPAATVPASTPVMARLPAVPFTATWVPSAAAPTVIGCPGPDCCTSDVMPRQDT
jgi:hypothetical protein